MTQYNVTDKHRRGQMRDVQWQRVIAFQSERTRIHDQIMTRRLRASGSKLKRWEMLEQPVFQRRCGAMLRVVKRKRTYSTRRQRRRDRGPHPAAADDQCAFFRDCKAFGCQ